MFAEIRLPYTNFGSSSSAISAAGGDSSSAVASPYGCRLNTNIDAASSNDSSTRPAGDTRADVSEFPQIMRQISKVKRMESLASKRRYDGALMAPAEEGPNMGNDDAIMGNYCGNPASMTFLDAASAAARASLSAANHASAMMPLAPSFGSGLAHASSSSMMPSSSQYFSSQYPQSYWENNVYTGANPTTAHQRQNDSGMMVAADAWNSSSLAASSMTMNQDGTTAYNSNDAASSSTAQCSTSISIRRSSMNAPSNTAKLPPSPSPSPYPWM